MEEGWHSPTPIDLSVHIGSHEVVPTHYIDLSHKSRWRLTEAEAEHVARVEGQVFCTHCLVGNPARFRPVFDVAWWAA